ncbi:AAA family ATPase [Nocardia abscessus]|uniref:AAA family ATPase n=1 Tax=Nocardia abscessus TaxID=120957 RepID=UPI001893395F|nr:MoxR family ATPase [Nocardia abscessus]MBF6339925.1 AAA family ATPase [Nocardia abscessus]
MDREGVIRRTRFWLADPADLPNSPFIGREKELLMCWTAWGVGDNGTRLLDNGVPPLSFRLEGAPGLGKNEIVYELARRLDMPLYILQGHEELTPEDMALMLTPDPDIVEGDPVRLTLRASPLATALYEGGLFFFDEINRVPERALSPLASVLDGRQYVYSAITGTNIGPQDDEARARFRFCCALNPAVSDAGYALPEYIEQRTLPVIEIGKPPFEDILRIIDTALEPSPEFLDAFQTWYLQEEPEDVSVRQVMALMRYAMNYSDQVGGDKVKILRRMMSLFVGRRH